MKNLYYRFVFLIAFLMAASFAKADAINEALTTLNGVWTAVSALAITVALFLIGRELLYHISDGRDRDKYERGEWEDK